MMCSVVAFGAFSQTPAKVTTKEAFDYQRSSLTVIPLIGHGADRDAINWADTTNFDGKFDMNTIKIRPVSGPNEVSAIKTQLQEQQVAKLILNYWLQYDGKKFGSEIIEKRARYNATDADYLKDQASKVQTLSYSGRNLMKNTFIMVAGPTSVEKKTDKKGKIFYNVKSSAHVYQVVLNDSILEEIWSNWLDDESTPEMIQKYELLALEIDPVASVASSETDSDLSKAVASSCNELLEKLENKIDKWQVVTSVYRRHPLGAKIGKKEGLKNSDRYAAYKIIEDENGELTYKRIAYVRATDISDNARDAEGNTDLSTFYQISGRGIKEGMYLKQKKDAKFSVSVSGNFGGYSPLSVEFDRLLSTKHTLGLMQYAGISIGGDFGKTFGENAFYVPIAINYGFGIHPVRVLELLPSVGIGADYYGRPDDLSTGSSDGDSESKFFKQIAYFARGGMKIGLQVCYPVQIFIRADYAYKISEGEYYISCDSHKRFGKVTFGAGIKINF